MLFFPYGASTSFGVQIHSWGLVVKETGGLCLEYFFTTVAATGNIWNQFLNTQFTEWCGHILKQVKQLVSILIDASYPELLLCY